ncbi:uncharacterized protein LOC106180687 isoform X1 [Lingula anatina]|uniref:Uncharacterized protein LOC106180687 isoform X1 n=1 Tax=Lingula anatina TaxID=7574 RepID=A0A1S3KCN7_LINAN|nr:uncharacterized protein LOC106180687 isoform X1 [Lingula anatina]XP_013420202.1 uncharacterized protein LOC106180687 isoform X1 [Lingula anatina]XP_013420203.1 uncharacterized protein LOC106180687 isoform X1 [Lingula anatina]XP_013420204.1 uncharacterized protein LOC106180687 isoform X1 [Lingula anatina]|eukprot:XP_013420201.1 uncharacterized protein LOC106180687 isoform X1 [Lingula anatina]
MSTATIRHMRPADLVEVVSLTEKESWNLSQEVVRTLFEYCPEGSFIAELQGKVVGAVMGFNLNEEESFGGMWIVSKQHRGQRIGTMLLQRLKEHIGDRNIGIFSDAESVEANKRYGFSAESWKICHVSGIIATEKIKLAEDCMVHVYAFPSRHVQFDDLFQYDTKIHSVERERFLRVWTQGKSTITLVAIGRTGEIVGYGVIKRYSNYAVVGPIYGETPSIMKTLLVSLIRKTTFGENINMSVPVESEILQELLVENKSTLKVLSEETRMFFHHEVKVPLEKILAITSSEASHC